MIPTTSTTHRSAIVFGSSVTQALRALGKREKREIEFICSYVFFEFNLYNVL